MQLPSPLSSRRQFIAQIACVAATALPLTAAEPAWDSLFDGKTLGNWKRTDFGGGSDPSVEDGVLLIERGEELAGVTYKGKPPTMNYELELEAQRRAGLDFFCGLTFPVNERHLTLVIGGWGGSTVGISSIDREDASQNETTLTRHFKDNQWYKVRLKVEPTRIQAWIDAEQIANVETKGKDLDLRPGEIDLSIPLGIATFRTTAAFRNIRLRKLQP